MYNSKEKFFELVQYQNESNKWDYKREFAISPKPAFANVFKDILAFANSGGGWLVLGVNDSGEITGVNQRIDITSLSQKINSVLGESIQCELNYYDVNINNEIVIVGLLYLFESEKVLISPKNLFDDKQNVLVKENTIYFRRNASSTQANADDLNTLIYRMSKLNKYEIDNEDLKFIDNKKSDYYMWKDYDDFLRGEYKFNTISFADKLNYISKLHQVKYTKYEIGMLLGFEEAHINEYFEGKRFPKLEHILRATEIFELEPDFFFQNTILDKKPLINHPIVSHVLLNKTQNKLGLINLGLGRIFKHVIYNLADEFALFKKWMLMDRDSFKVISGITEKSDELFIDNDELRIYKKYEVHLKELNDETYKKFKNHLSVQYYKEIEKTPETSEVFLNEKIIKSIIYGTVDFVAKFLSELIKEIYVEDGIMKIEYNFLYEVQNKVARARNYDSNNFEVIFKESTKI